MTLMLWLIILAFVALAVFLMWVRAPALEPGNAPPAEPVPADRRGHDHHHGHQGGGCCG